MERTTAIVRKTDRVDCLVGQSADDELVLVLRADLDEALAMAGLLRLQIDQVLTAGVDPCEAKMVTIALAPLARWTLLAPETNLLAAANAARTAFARRSGDRVLRLPPVDPLV